MENIPVIEAPAEEVEQIQAEIRRYFDEIERAGERMKNDQAEIERMKTRTRAMLTELAQLRAG